MIDSLRDQVGGEDIAVAVLYYDFLAQQGQTITNMMGAILKQLVGREGIPEDIQKAFRRGRGKLSDRGVRLEDLMGMLRTTITSLRQVFICIDALDESLPKDLPKLLESLSDIVRGSPRARIFLTGRPDVEEAIRRCFTKTVTMPISPNEDDIRFYAVRRLDRDDVPEAMDNSLRAEIVRTILDKMSNMYAGLSPLSMMYIYYRLCRFLLVSLNIDAILGEVTIPQRRKRLEEVAGGNELSNAYTATLRRMQTQEANKSVLGLRALMWVSYSERPLRAEELCHALGVEIGYTDLDRENVPELRTLLSSCLGLLTLEASSSTIRLVHFTLQEHLLSDPTLFYSPHLTIAEVCLTYLNFRQVRDLPPNLYSAPTTMPLLEYASYYWGDHTRRGMTENVKILALRLLDKFDEHISAQLLLLRYNQGRIPGPCFHKSGGPTGFTGLHGVAFLGIANIVTAVLDMKEWDVNAADCVGSTALTWATRRGQEEVIKVLLEREDINPNIADTQDGRTPLTLAAESGFEGVLKILLEREDVNPNHPDTKFSRTPLSWAAENGHEGVVKILLEREDVNPNTADTEYGRTPLSWAAQSGHSGVVKILLEREDVNPNTADTKYGRTPLSWAAENGHSGVVKILLEQEDVNPNATHTYYDQTPLLWAAQNGHSGVVKILLEREDVNPNTVDTFYGRTPLSWAAEKGHEGVVKILLEREDVNPNAADTKYGRTPLSWAAEYGHEGVVKVLLEREDIHATTPDNMYQTPFSLALSRGHDGVARILLEQGQVEKQAVEKSVAEEPKKISIPTAEQVSERLKDIIINHRKGLQKMYGETELELDRNLKVQIKKGEEMARNLIRMGCNIEVAKNLTLLTLHDVAILIGMLLW